MKKPKRVQTWVKREIASLIERYFGAKGYRIDRKPLIFRGPHHLRVSTIEKDQDGVAKDWSDIHAFVFRQFEWAPSFRWSKYGNHLFILIGNI